MRLRIRPSYRILTLASALALAACGGSGSAAPGPGPGPGTPPDLGLGALEGDAASFAAIPAADPRLDGAVAATSRLPASTDLRGLLPEVRSQGGQGSCVGWCTAYYTKTAIERKEEGWAVTSGFTNIFAPPYIYNQRSNRPSSGMHTQEGAERLVSQGCCRWPLMPYAVDDESTQPSAAAHAEAAVYRAARVQRFGTYRSITNANVEEMKGWLSDEGTPIITAMDWYSDVQYFRNRSADEDVIQDAKGGTQLGGHCIAVVGYDDNVSSGSFLLCNSHGTQWGNDGFAWIPYVEFQRVAKEAFGVVDLPNGTAPNPNPNQDSNNFISGAGTIAYGQTANGSIGDHNNDPADWWKFAATQGDVAHVRLTGLTADADVKIADVNDNRLAFSANWGTSDEDITYAIPSSGTYYIKVYPYDDAQTSYSLSLTSLASEGNNSSANPSGLGLNTNYNGSVGGSDPRDWWRMTVGASKLITVTLTGLSADIDIYLYRSGDLGGDYWLRSIHGGTSSESLSFVSSSSGGSYYVLVVPYAGAVSNYVLRAQDDSNRPNLKADSYNVTYWNYSDRVEVQVNELKVTNAGTASSPEFVVDWGLSASNVRGSSYWPGSPGWGGGGTLQPNWTRTWSSGMATRSKSALGSGSYYFVFEADADRVISEPDELDNFVYSSSPLVSK